METKEKVRKVGKKYFKDSEFEKELKIYEKLRSVPNLKDKFIEKTDQIIN
jgi:hypothetical protein